MQRLVCTLYLSEKKVFSPHFSIKMKTNSQIVYGIIIANTSVKSHIDIDLRAYFPTTSGSGSLFVFLRKGGLKDDGKRKKGHQV